MGEVVMFKQHLLVTHCVERAVLGSCTERLQGSCGKPADSEQLEHRESGGATRKPPSIQVWVAMRRLGRRSD